jgi:hypothetical protein
LGRAAPAGVHGTAPANGTGVDGARAAAGVSTHARLPWTDTTDQQLQRPKHTAPATVAPATLAPVHTATRSHAAVSGLQSELLRKLNHTAGSNGAIADEFRRVAAQHAASYAPGHVPKWLERQTDGGAAHGQPTAGTADGVAEHTAAGAGGGIAPATLAPRPVVSRRSAGALAGGDSASHEKVAAAVSEHARHRWLLLSLLTLWGCVLFVAVARWMRLCSCRGGKRRPRKPGEARSDLLHRF